MIGSPWNLGGNRGMEFQSIYTSEWGHWGAPPLQCHLMVCSKHIPTTHSTRETELHTAVRVRAADPLSISPHAGWEVCQESYKIAVKVKWCWTLDLPLLELCVWSDEPGRLSILHLLYSEHELMTACSCDRLDHHRQSFPIRKETIRLLTSASRVGPGLIGWPI